MLKYKEILDYLLSVECRFFRDHPSDSSGWPPDITEHEKTCNARTGAIHKQVKPTEMIQDEEKTVWLPKVQQKV